MVTESSCSVTAKCHEVAQPKTISLKDMLKDTGVYWRPSRCQAARKGIQSVVQNAVERRRLGRLLRLIAPIALGL